MNDKRDRACESSFFSCWESVWKLYLLKHDCEKINKFYFQNIGFGYEENHSVSDIVKVDNSRSKQFS